MRGRARKGQIQESGVRSQEAEVRKQEAEVRSQESGVQESGDCRDGSVKAGHARDRSTDPVIGCWCPVTHETPVGRGSGNE